jgi:hypothetical protein
MPSPRFFGAGNPAAIAFAGAIVATAPAVAGLELRPPTLAAYDRYVTLTEARLSQERSGASPFLWIDRQPAAVRDGIMARLRAGEVVVERMETKDAGRTIAAPGGLIHHWLGTVALPGVGLDRVVSFVQDYDRYPEVFAPLIARSRVKNRTGDRFVVAMRTSVKKVISVVMDGDYVIDYHRLGAHRVWTTNVATELHQVEDPDTPQEQAVPTDKTSGYLWRFRMYCAFEEREGLSLEQCESITLTRSIPFGLGWIVGRFVSGIPRDTMVFTLGQVRGALVAN